jgi:hypothetical protein
MNISLSRKEVEEILEALDDVEDDCDEVYAAQVITPLIDKLNEALTEMIKEEKATL